MTRWSTYAALMLAAFALAATAGAQTGNPELGRVLGERAQAGAALSAQVEHVRARHELESALTARGQVLNEALAASQPAAHSAAGGFDWGAAGAGAGATLALVLAALGTVFLVRRGRLRKALALTVLAAVAMIAAGAALGTPPFLFSATQHARGTLEGHFKIKLKDRENDPRDAAIVQVTQGVGGHSGWHAHPGPAIVIVKSGELTIQQAKDCSSRTYTAGQAVVEPSGHVHIARNTGTTTLELWITFLDVPAGAPTRIDAPDPGC